MSGLVSGLTKRLCQDTGNLQSCIRPPPCRLDSASPVACWCRSDRGRLLANAPNIHTGQAAQHRPYTAPNILCVLQSRCIVHDMASTTDHRRLAQHHRGLYFTDDQRDQELDTRFEELIGHQEPQQATVEVQMGRKIQVPAAGGSQSAVLSRRHPGLVGVRHAVLSRHEVMHVIRALHVVNGLQTSAAAAPMIWLTGSESCCLSGTVQLADTTAWGRSASCLAAQESFCSCPSAFCLPASAGEHACKFAFHDLCGRNIGAADFIALADRYHTMALQAVPIFTGAMKSEAYRHVHAPAPARASEPATVARLQQPIQITCLAAEILLDGLHQCLHTASIGWPQAVQLACAWAWLLSPHQLILPLLHVTRGQQSWITT